MKVIKVLERVISEGDQVLEIVISEGDQNTGDSHQ